MGGRTQATDGPGPWAREADGFLRAFGGAFLFGVPLLYTMEMWWIGQYTPVWKVGVFLLAAFLVNLYLAGTTGFKSGPRPALDALDQAVDATAVGLIGAAGILLILNRFGPGEPPGAVAGMVALQAVPLSIGAAIAGSILGTADGEHKSREGDDNGGPAPGPWKAAGVDAAATLAGGLFIGLPIAPTDEIPMLAAGMTAWHLLALGAVTFGLTYLIVFEAGFHQRQSRQREASPLSHPGAETAAAYILSLMVAAGLLVLYGRLEWGDPAIWALSQTLVLGLPVAIGGAAGRLVA